MSKLVWDQLGEKLYETGVDKCVYYKQNSSGAYPTGVAWNGITNITETPSGADVTKLWADNIKYLELRSVEELGGTIEAYMYPPEFAESDGSKEVMEGVTIGQQTRAPFGLSYVTKIGNDTQKDEYGYKLHLVWGASVKPSQRAYATINDSPNAITFSWEFSTTPVAVTNNKPTSLMIIDSTKVDSANLTVLEGVLYGGDNTTARLPLPDDVITILTTGQIPA